MKPNTKSKAKSKPTRTKKSYPVKVRAVSIRPAQADHSSEQQAVYNVILETDDNAVVIAAAGSGKTFTLSHLAWQIEDRRSDYRMTYVVFNTRNKNEAESKFPASVDVSTLHSLGCQILKSAGRIWTDREPDFKVWNFIAKMCPDPSLGINNEVEKGKVKKEWARIKMKMKKLIDMARIKMLDQTVEDMMVCAVEEQIDLPPHWIAEAYRVLQEMNRQFWGDKTEVYPTTGIHCDFVDMIYLPSRFPEKCKLDKVYDLVMVDEFQDVSPMIYALLDTWLFKKNTRTIVVGDKAQAIYQFAGADIKFFDLMVARADTQVLTLGTCYRCAPEIITEARQYVDYIHPWDGAASGEVVRDGDYEIAADGDFILCRKNRPIVSICLDMLGNGKRAVVRGRDIAEKLKELLDDVPEGVDFIQWLDNWVEAWITKTSEARGWEEARVLKSEIFKDVKDRIGVLKDMAARMPVTAMSAMIDAIFSDSETPNAVILSTIHKSKGLEADRVFVLDIGTIKDANLKYVAITRARKYLAYCTSPFADDDVEEVFGVPEDIGLSAIRYMDHPDDYSPSDLHGADKLRLD